MTALSFDTAITLRAHRQFLYFYSPLDSCDFFFFFKVPFSFFILEMSTQTSQLRCFLVICLNVVLFPDCSKKPLGIRPSYSQDRYEMTRGEEVMCFCSFCTIHIQLDTYRKEGGLEKRDPEAKGGWMIGRAWRSGRRMRLFYGVCARW